MTRLPEPSERRRRSPAVPKRARETFLEHLAAGFSITHAADHAGVYRRRLYELRDADEAFRQAWADAFEAGTDVLRDELRRRAVDGFDEPLVSAGKIVGVKRVYSDRLLELELKRRDPSYRDRGDVRVSVGGIDGGPVRLQTGVSLGEVAAFMREHVPGFQAQLDEGEPAGEIVAETDESIEENEA